MEQIVNVNETIQMSKNLFAFCDIHFTLEIWWVPFNNNPEKDIILQQNQDQIIIRYQC